MTTLLSRRTQITVVDRIFSRIVYVVTLFYRTAAAGLSECYIGSVAYNGVPRENIAFGGVIRTELGAAAFLAGERTASDQ
jgi:hypothetical protein